MTGDADDEARIPPTIVRAEVVRRAPEVPAPPTMPSVRDRQREVRRRLERDANRPVQLARRWAGLLLFLALFGIVYCTLFPFNFTVPSGMSLREAAHAFTWKLYDPSNIADSWQNILLFGPLGFALAALAYSRRKGRAVSALVPIAAGAMLSTSVEILQLWLPTRVSALGDIVTNTVGTACGSVLFVVCGSIASFRGDNLPELDPASAESGREPGADWPDVARGASLAVAYAACWSRSDELGQQLSAGGAQHAG